jgi:hypothetical protein
MIDELLKVGGLGFLVPCVIAVIVVSLAKGMFGLHQSRRGSRKDFLDLWSDKDHHDELWRQAAVRHLFGAWLPTSIIQALMHSPQAGRALVEVSAAWELLEFNDEAQTVDWKAARHRDARNRGLEIGVFAVLYWLLALLAIYCFINAVVGPQGGLGSITRWALTVELILFSIACLDRSESLKYAGKAVPRWLGLR